MTRIEEFIRCNEGSTLTGKIDMGGTGADFTADHYDVHAYGNTLLISGGAETNITIPNDDNWDINEDEFECTYVYPSGVVYIISID